MIQQAIQHNQAIGQHVLYSVAIFAIISLLIIAVNEFKFPGRGPDKTL